ncbi:MAG: putative glycolipid-binding domain-containing protein [Chitinophagaceae bacterium]
MKNKNQKIVWKSNYENTMEFVSVEIGKFIAVNGHITGESDGKLFHVSYKLRVDLCWDIEEVQIDFQSDTSFKKWFQKNKNHEWFNENDKLLPEFTGCTTIDISLSPFTNTLPINNLNLPEGLTKEIRVNYINLLALECKSVKQRYTNLSNHLYKFEDLTSGFTSSIEIDEEGYVIDYPGLWHRVFPGNNTQKSFLAKDIFCSALLSEINLLQS